MFVLLSCSSDRLGNSHLESITPQEAVDAGAAALVQRASAGVSPFASHLCGALLVERSVAVTAAHCVENREARSLAIRLSSPDLCDATDPRAELLDVLEVERLGTVDEDIVLLRTQPSRAALPGRIEAPTQANAAWAVGWGSLTKGGPFVCDLKTIPIIVGSPDDCAAGKPGTSRESFARTFFCGTGRDRLNTCAGDSGSPVFDLRSGSWAAIGITLSGEGCAPDDQGVYFRLDRLHELCTEASDLVRGGDAASSADGSEDSWPCLDPDLP